MSSDLNPLRPVFHELHVPPYLPISQVVEGPICLFAMPKKPSPATRELVSSPLTSKLVTPSGAVLSAGMDTIAAGFIDDYLFFSCKDGATSSTTPQAQTQLCREASAQEIELPAQFVTLPTEPTLNFKELATLLFDFQTKANMIGGDNGVTAMYKLLYLLGRDILTEAVSSGDTNMQFTLSLKQAQSTSITEGLLPMDRIMPSSFLISNINSTSGEKRPTKINHTSVYLSHYKRYSSTIFVFWGSDGVMPILKTFIQSLTPNDSSQMAIQRVIQSVLKHDQGEPRDDLTLGAYKLNLMQLF